MCTLGEKQVLVLLQLLFLWTTQALAQAPTPFILPLKVSPIKLNGNLPRPPPVTVSRAAPFRNDSGGRLRHVDAEGLALALDPARGLVNFLPMIDNLQGDAGLGYYLEMLIGTPPQKLQILVDTGSSNFAVAGVPDPHTTSYFDIEKSYTYQSKNLNINVKYTQGSWTGSVGEDVVTIPKGFNSTFLVNVAVIFESEDFFLPKTKWNGILGLAYATLAKVMGGIEPSLYKGDIWYTTIKREWYYQIEILKLEIGGQNLNLDCREYNVDKAIVDSGTTLLHLPQKVFDAVVKAISQTSLISEFSEEFWTGSQLACWKYETPWSYFPNISIYFRDENSSKSFRITVLPQLYILPVLGIDSNYECYRFGISSSANSLVIGATVMEGFYVVFDRAQKRIGFALSSCAKVDGVPVSEISGPFSTDDIASSCISFSTSNEPILWIVSYALMTLCGIIFLVLIILLFPFCSLNCSRDRNLVNDESCLVQHRWK
ncbi:beta-secretase 2 isoform 2-T2 [Sarcophilus harrisii]|uniref:Beta-secretase 2 n=1 Tax=Sarcophilus harrisii TaxID=9305 RepID=A0A7N4UXY7_SARHA